MRKIFCFFSIFWILILVGKGEAQVPFLSSYSIKGTHEVNTPFVKSPLDGQELETVYWYNASNQCTAIFRGYQNQWISRCFYFYDAEGFLEKVILDNGQGQELEDVTGVSHRHIIRAQIGHQGPIRGKPLKIEDYYWRPHCSDPNGELIYEMAFQYDQEGQLLSTLDSQGEGLYKLNLAPHSRSPLSSFTENSQFFSNQDEDEDEDLSELQESFSLSQIWNDIVNSFYYCFQYLQVSAHQARFKWSTELNLPGPLEKALEGFGKAFLGESTYLLMGPHFEETQVDSYGQHEISDKVRVTFINGILNTQNMMLDTLKAISDSHGGVNIHYVFRPTEGWTWDISRAIMIKMAYTLGFRSLHAHLLAQLWRELIQDMGGVEGNGVIIHYAHSLGGSETDRARDLLTPEEQKMIRVITFGSSTLIRNEGFQSVINMVSAHDGVSSFFLEPLGHIRNYFDPNTNIRFYSLPESPSWPTDHLLQGPTYRLLLRECGERFLAEFTSDTPQGSLIFSEAVLLHRPDIRLEKSCH